MQQRDTLLRRFADEAQLNLVQAAITGVSDGHQDREAIIWFSDIVGFSGWSRGKPANQIAEVARRILSRQIDLIRGAGGAIDKLMGDGLMAFWFVDTNSRRATAPPAALTCALKVADEFQTSHYENEASLDIRIGLHFGRVAFGDFGARDRIAVTLLGEAVNLAARYEQAKDRELGRIRISPTLRSLALEARADLSAFRGPITASVKADQFEIYTASGGHNVVE